MNISGFVLKATHEVSNEALAQKLDFEITATEKASWIDYDAGIGLEDKLLVYRKNGGMIVYYDLDFLDNRTQKIKSLFLNGDNKITDEACLFVCSETAMAFEFSWYDKGSLSSTDTYLYEDELKTKGSNRLGLSEDEDAIFDGLFPLFDKFLNGCNDEDEVDVISFDYTAANQAPQANIASSFNSTQANAEQGISNENMLELIDQLARIKNSHYGYKRLKSIKDGYVQLNRAQIRDNFEDLGFTSHIAYSREITFKKLQRLISLAVEELESSKRSLPPAAIKYIAVLWSRFDHYSDAEIQDNYYGAKWWEFWR
ncbi:MAG: hypothetical protein RL660_1738 [Bacteroidota bacterium]